MIIDIHGQWVYSWVIPCGKEVGIAAVQFDIIINSEVRGCLDVAQEKLAVEDHMQVAQGPGQFLR